MKANRKFLANDEEAVSPVIAVILMVAITVVLAATVYVWVSGFGAQSGTPAKSIALSSAGAIDPDCSGVDDCKPYTVASATPGMKYSDMKITIDGVEFTLDTGVCTNGVADADGEYCATAGSSTRASTDLVQAGDKLTFRRDDTSGGASGNTLSGLTLQVLDSNANSVLLTLTIS